jgi:methylphosphotriester-DNA--protein-cysteine methyltransferase
MKDQKIDTNSARQASAARHADVVADIAQMLGKDAEHSTVQRLAAIVVREVRHTHSMYEAYTDYLADRANGYAIEVPA